MTASVASHRTQNERIWVSQYDSPLGIITANWDDGKLARLSISAPDKSKASRRSSEVASEPSDESLVQLLHERLDDFFRGSRKQFPWKLFALGPRTDFQLRVLRCCYEIPPGQTVTYGDLAAAAGKPGAARAAGTVMAKNTIPLLIPCHRVVASSGKLGGYSAPGGISVKQWLLDRESKKVAW